MNIRKFGFAGVSLLLGACAGAGIAPVTFVVLQSGLHSSFTGGTYRDIHHQADYEALWDQAFAAQGSRPPMPPVDFSKQMVLGLFVGRRSHGGYSVRMDRVQDAVDALDVYFTIIAPGSRCQVTQAVIEPYAVVAVPASGKPVRFHPASQYHDC